VLAFVARDCTPDAVAGLDVAAADPREGAPGDLPPASASRAVLGANRLAVVAGAFAFLAVRSAVVEADETGDGGGSRNVVAMSSISGRSIGMLLINVATCRHANTRSATWPGLSTRPARETRICISAGLIDGTGVGGSVIGASVPLATIP
jgi:hypothetical protein